jgi:drug/metabolite transporter (DMT)-like permease
MPELQRCGIALFEQAVFFLTGHGLYFGSMASPAQLWQTAQRIGVYRRIAPLYVDSGPQPQLERFPVTAPVSVLSALAAALLFGASTPFAKALLAGVPPILLAVLTALLAWVVFGENADRRIVLGMALIVGGGVVLAWPQGGAARISAPGALAVAGTSP